MRPFFRFHRPRHVLAVILGCTLAVVAAAALFDWNWLRHPVERYLSKKSGREVRIAHLHITPGLEPTIRLRGVYVENAPWADRRPMAVAGEVSFTVSLASIREGRPIISHLVLVDAEVDLERQADGQRNWRLTHPEYRGPGIVRVLVLEAHRSRIRFVNREAGLDLVGTSTPLAQEAPGSSGETLTSTITLEGEIKSVRFSGSALGGRFLSFRDSNRFFPLRGRVASGKTTFEFDGVFSDLFDLGPMDADLSISGPTLANLHPFIRLRPAPSRPYRLAAHVKQAGNIYHVTGLRGTVGDTDIAGEVHYDRSRERPFVGAVLRSARADLADFASLAGIHGSGDGDAAVPDTQAAARGDAVPKSGRDSAALFPSRPLHLDALRTFDADVSLQTGELKTAGKVLAVSLRVAARIADGALETKALDFGVAGGRVSGEVAADARSDPPSARVLLDLQAVRLEQLSAALSLPGRVSGAVNGRVELTGKGASVAELLGSADGSVKVSVSGGHIPSLLDAKLALNPVAVFGAWVSGKSDAAVHCAAAAFDVHGGVGPVRRIELDTDRTRVEGKGSIDLGKEQLDVLLTPEPKNPGIFDRHETIRVRGPFRNLKVSLEKRGPAGERALAAGSRARCG